MQFNEYQALAQRTSNTDLTHGEHVINGVLGLCGEAGEAADIVKKAFMQGHHFDREHIMKELGDCLWYIAETAAALGVDMDTIAQQNVEKLEKRYPDGHFDVKRSMHREAGDI